MTAVVPLHYANMCTPARHVTNSGGTLLGCYLYTTHQTPRHHAVAPHTRVAISRKTPLILYHSATFQLVHEAAVDQRPWSYLRCAARARRAFVLKTCTGTGFLRVGLSVPSLCSCSVTAARPCSLLVLRRLVLVLRRLVLVLRRLVLVLAISDSSPTRALYAMGHPAPAPAPARSGGARKVEAMAGSDRSPSWASCSASTGCASSSSRREMTSRLCRGARRFFFTRPGATPGSPGRAIGSSCGPEGGRGGMGRLASAEGYTSAIRSSCTCIDRIRALPAWMRVMSAWSGSPCACTIARPTSSGSKPI